MTTTGDFKLYLNGKEVTEQEVRDCKENMSVTIKNLSVFYSFSPKIENQIEADYIGFTGSSMRRGKVLKYSRPIDKTICASDIVNSAKKLETEEIKDDVVTNINRGEQDLIQWLDSIVKEKDKTEKLVFTALEKELTSEKQQGHLSTRHKKPGSMTFLDEVVGEQIKTEGIKNSQKEVKAPIFTYCKVNKNALEALALRALYGHQKYNKDGADEDWQNFTRVSNGDFEYSNAQFRHALEIGGEETEEEHLISSAWNAISRLQIYLNK